MKESVINVSRRHFLKSSAAFGAGLTLGIYIPNSSAQVEAGPGQAGKKIIGENRFEPNAFVRIGTDNIVTVISKHLEMGQGAYTGLATLVAEEMDADWSQIRVEGAPADAKRYNNLFWGPNQGTGGSTAIANSFKQMREAGASAREMLLGAAAQKWGVNPEDLAVEKGLVMHPTSKKKATFGELSELAAQQPVPTEVLLKEPDEFALIGQTLARKDTTEKTNGKATFTQDVKLPGMLTAVVLHPPRFGGKPERVDSCKARAVKGVVDVVVVDKAVAVVGKDFWSAVSGRDELSVTWDESHAFKQGTVEIMASYKEIAWQPGLPARVQGNAESSLKNAAKRFSADYEFPYLAHAAMEPMNCVVDLKEDGCEIWNGEQLHTGDQHAIANLLGIKPEQVTINMLYAGGSFGRRANPQSDYVLEAVRIARALQKRVPVKLVWTREDDMKAGYYRPMYFHSLQAGLNKEGKITAWQHRIVGQSIMKGTAFEGGLIKDGIDQTSVEGATNIPYDIKDLSVELHTTENGVPVQWWRSVGSTHTAFAVETFIDELAAAAGKDPVAMRQGMMKNHPRHQGVLELAATKAGWGKPMAKGRGRGVAVHESFNTFVAQVAEVTVADGTFSVDRVVIAVDCGIAINPDVIRAQMEGGMGFGLAAALDSEITLENGYVQQGNFDDYIVLRMSQMPKVEVHIVKSAEAPTGVGEPATPVIAPAVANALSAVTGKRFYQLPIKLPA
ncbi:MAG: xanthine dehydrogenase family protein molybdopterin-binding subunit [Gammaproteobacteria bacterium]|nr:MAG: xanthine dehydrogenase family protein molybdopterin-binding subunit [Gammaproteobacteria bacterium]